MSDEWQLERAHRAQVARVPARPPPPRPLAARPLTRRRRRATPTRRHADTLRRHVTPTRRADHGARTGKFDAELVLVMGERMQIFKCIWTSFYSFWDSCVDVIVHV